MKITDLDRLKKFMALTASTNDAEALSALRMANKLLAANKITWVELISKQVTYEMDFGADAATPPPDGGASPESQRHAAMVNAAFEKAFTMVKPGGFRNFLDKLHHEWKENGWLPDKAIQTVKNAGIPWSERAR